MITGVIRQREVASMSIYEEHCLPHLTNCVCGLAPLSRQRELIVPLREDGYWKWGWGPRWSKADPLTGRK